MLWTEEVKKYRRRRRRCKCRSLLEILPVDLDPFMYLICYRHMFSSPSFVG